MGLFDMTERAGLIEIQPEALIIQSGTFKGRNLSLKALCCLTETIKKTNKKYEPVQIGNVYFCQQSTSPNVCARKRFIPQEAINISIPGADEN